MTGPELKAWRLARKMSARQAGLWYGLATASAERTWRRYESGAHRVPGPLIKRIHEDAARHDLRRARV